MLWKSRIPKDTLGKICSLACVLLALAAGGCTGDTGATGTPGLGQPRRKALEPWENLPGLVVTITELSGGTGPGGNFLPGDTMSVTFTVQDKDGKDVELDDLDRGAIMVSGPTSNYQRVIASVGDLKAAAVKNAGTAPPSYTYTFATPFPGTYLPPINDTPSFGATHGELQGTALLDGTYTVGIEARVDYTIGGETFRDATNGLKDFLVGNATSLDLREVVKQENCNQCHTELRVHGENRRNVRSCLLCHTAGAEDKNVASAANGTPGVTIDFKVMIHKIHNAKHLPSVLGVATNADGSRNYKATTKPYKVVGFRNSVHDYSEIGFPVWPNLSMPLPRDAGYSKLGRTEQGLENTLRGGAATCVKCHGDPDGSGPVEAPKQGDKAFSNPTRVACGSCHDDIDWSKPYTANLLTMQPQTDDSKCLQCHPASGSVLATLEGHIHPLFDQTLNRGLKLELTAVKESGKNNGNGKLDPDEKVKIEFRIRDRNDLEVKPADLARMEVVVNGPTTNRNILLETRWPTAALKSANVSSHIPYPVFLDYLGDSTATGGEVFTSSMTPHWNVSGATTAVYVRKTPAPASNTTLSKPAAALQNYIDVADVTGFERGKYVVIDDGVAGKEEYLRIQWVDDKRLWFSSGHSPYNQPWLRKPHDANASVAVVEFDTKKVDTDYKLSANDGKITEVTEFGAGKAVLASFTTDFVIPKVYPPAVNDSPDLDETWGKWTGKSLVGGTYTVGIWGELSISLTRSGETNGYVGASKPATRDFLLGSATKLASNTTLSSVDNCYKCHDDMYFHGSHRRGVETCLLCHGTSGAEDRPRYVAANAPATTGVSIDFRRMLHKIHHGKELANKSSYTVVGFGRTWPNNYSGHTYEHVGFPSMVGGTKNCAACHGDGNEAWQLPANRNHPKQQGKHARVWMVSCGSCHDSTAAQAHIELQTTQNGAESCDVCHGAGREYAVDLAHKKR